MHAIRFIISVFLFLSFSILYSQNELIENEWSFQKMVISGENIYPPDTDEFNPINLAFVEYEFDGDSNYFFYSGVCTSLEGLIIYMTDSEFSFLDISCCAFGSTCTEPENMIFENLYLNFYIYFFESIFTYDITSNTSGGLNLVITNIAGNEMHYSNQKMAVSEVEESGISIYPNPVKNQLTIDNNGSKKAFIKILNALGELVWHQELSSGETKLDFNFPKGVYYLTIESEGKILKTEKVIKN